MTQTIGSVDLQSARVQIADYPPPEPLTLVQHTLVFPNIVERRQFHHKNTAKYITNAINPVHTHTQIHTGNDCSCWPERRGGEDHIYGFKPTLLTLLAHPQLPWSLTSAATGLNSNVLHDIYQKPVA